MIISKSGVQCTTISTCFTCTITRIYISYSQDIRVLNFRIHKFRPKVSFIFSKKKQKKRPMMNAMTNK